MRSRFTASLFVALVALALNAEDWHVPDLLTQFTDGSFGLLDVRPAELVDDRARLQFVETSKVCSMLGWRYRVLIRRDRRVVWQYSRTREKRDNITLNKQIDRAEQIAEGTRAPEEGPVRHPR